MKITLLFLLFGDQLVNYSCLGQTKNIYRFKSARFKKNGLESIQSELDEHENDMGWDMVALNLEWEL